MREIIFIRQGSANMGGVQWQIVNLAEKLYARGYFKPVLITSDANCPFAKNFANRNFDVLTVPMGKASIFSASKKILHLLESRDVAVIQTHLLRESFIGRAVRRKRPDIQHVFRCQVYPSGITNPVWKKSLCHFLDGLTSRWVDCYIANGRYLADEIINRSRVNSKKVTVLLNGKDQIGLPDEPSEAPDKPLPGRIAMIANLTKGKGHDSLIRAVAILKEKKITLKTTLIGGGLVEAAGAKGRNYESAMKKLACDLGVAEQIEFHGYSKDVCASLAGIAVIVLPSDSEGVPNCILEAMSLRKLIVASDTGGVSEIITDGKDGFLHKPKDPAGLARILEDVFTRKAKEFESIRSAGFVRWQREFTGDKMVDEIVEIYKRIGVL